ncbi:thiol reductant ABC exporter subunit CydD [Alteromonas hispanica]|uniref:Thiol reductant ABC exporter subunit CydD n=1 Tax=Alteromonas hispanica TaxID=315421 RepID=A0A6L9MX31_9ALTE|nr:thiol reductant ABC exporter subunit CydD [Alteromonas hispanica]NDW22647.1 thiol reductant ABC exporter subunit CydD [Alteromonas hispanica]
MNNKPAPMPDMTNISGTQFLKQQIASQRPLLYRSVVFGGCASLFMIAQWLLVAFIAHSVLVDSSSLSSLWVYWLLLIVVSVVKPWLNFQQSNQAQVASAKVKRSIRSTLMTRWNNTSPVALQILSGGAIASQWIEDIEAIDGYFSRYWPQQMLAVLSPLFIIIVVAYLNWLCAVLLLVSAPLIPLFMVLVGMGAEHINEKYALLRQRLAGHFLDRIANLSTISLLGAQQTMSEEVATRGDNYRQVVMKTLKLAFLSSTVLEFFTSVAIASLAIYIGFSLYGAINWGPAQSLTLYSGLAILLLAPEFFKPLRNLSAYYHDKASAVGAANNIVASLTQLQYEEEQYGNGDARKITLSERDARLELKNLVVGYRSHLPLNKSVTAEISKRGLLVFSGDSGCGKTTLLNTLAGYLNPIAGEVNVTINSKRSIAYLPQKAWIKNASIRHNLAIAAPAANDPQMLAALEKLDLTNEITLKHQGLDTVLGEHGQGLSGGQMQRISLARVLLNPSQIILLDEPTASLDIKSKGLIYGAIEELREKAIIAISTHDPRIVSMADIHIDLTKKVKAPQ